MSGCRQSAVSLHSSVHLDNTVDLCNKPETGKEANRTWNQKESLNTNTFNVPQDKWVMYPVLFTGQLPVVLIKSSKVNVISGKAWVAEFHSAQILSVLADQLALRWRLVKPGLTTCKPTSLNEFPECWPPTGQFSVLFVWNLMEVRTFSGS